MPHLEEATGEDNAKVLRAEAVLSQMDRMPARDQGQEGLPAEGRPWRVGKTQATGSTLEL